MLEIIKHLEDQTAEARAIELITTAYSEARQWRQKASASNHSTLQ
jgi:hypothetical protein